VVLTAPPPEAHRLAEIVAARGLTVATAESMTGGAVAESLVGVPGSSEWLAGGVIAYMSRVKYDLLGVRHGPVICGPAAQQMATGVARLMHTDVGIATTGCAGPDTMEDQPVGTLWVGIAVGSEVHARHCLLDGDPATIRTGAVRFALHTAAELLG
jgi:PncC family amidohydrolase